MRRIVNNFISVLVTMIKIVVLKMVRGTNFNASIVQRISPNVVLEFNKGSKVALGRRVRIHSGSKIKVRPCANLIIENNVKMNYNCIIVCHEKIVIGEGTEFGPSVYLYDHDHDYKMGLNSDSTQERYLKAPIIIGKNCWIGANTIILRGTVLGDGCVVGAGSVVKGIVPAGTVYTQKRTVELRRVKE